MKIRAMVFCAAIISSVASSADLMGMGLYTGAAQGNLILRDSPPSWPFYGKGSRIGTIQKNSVVTVVERKDIPILFAVQEWLLVEQKCTDGRTRTGWLYNGKLEGDAKPYVLEGDAEPNDIHCEA